MHKLVTLRRRPWSVFDELESLQAEMDSAFFGRGKRAVGRKGHAWLAPVGFCPRADVSETEKEITVAVELPGMDRKDITVEFDEGNLVIRGEREAEKEEEGRNWHRRERSHGSFHRTIVLSADVDQEAAKAEFKKGVLTVTLPKQEELPEEHKTVNIEGE